ncbi:MAG: Ig-like domain-containing protein [Gemmatimonadaceae bacterium]
MLASRGFFGAAAIVFVAVAVGCGGGTDAPPVARVVITPGSQTLFAVGATVQLTAEARSSDGAPISGAGFTWTSLDPAASVSSTGLVSAAAAGTARVIATAQTKADTAEITVFISQCGTSTPLSLSVGAVHELTPQERAELCVAGAGGGTEYVLVPFHANAASSATVQLEVLANGIIPPVGPPTPSREPDVAAAFGAAPRAALENNVAFELGLRQRERRELTPRIPGARADRAARLRLTPRFAVAAAPPPVGTLLQLNAQSSSACSNANMRTGRVAAVTQRAIVVHDESNPSGGFSDAEYQEVGSTFDQLVYSLNVANFGQETDIDDNQRVIIFYTRVVNELTPAGSQGIVGGFFFARDLFPVAGSPPRLDPCATSNEAEMFYILAPDPTGSINTNPRTKDFVRSRTIAIIAHEFEHLINASRRIYVNNANAFEEVWLDEGLAHIAEELLFYQESQLTPRQNIRIQQLTQAGPVNTAVNAYQVSNFGRLIQYVRAPETNSPFASNDELATRGATWQLLRYLADRTRVADGTIWFDLVNSTAFGLANLANVVGADPLQLARDFVVAQYADDGVSGGASTFTHPSWHYREILPALIQGGAPPLRVRPLADGVSQTIALIGGGAGYLKFGVSGPFASVRVQSQGVAVPSSVRLTLVRAK